MAKISARVCTDTTDDIKLDRCTVHRYSLVEQRTYAALPSRQSRDFPGDFPVMAARPGWSPNSLCACAVIHRAQPSTRTQGLTIIL